MQWDWWYRYVLNVDTISIIVITCVVIYFIWTAKRKKYKFAVPGVKWEQSTAEKKKSKNKNQKLNKHEEECRRIFQNLFGVKFKSVRPKWLKNPSTKKNLELDGFNAAIKTNKGYGLAFEYDGQQHSKYTPHFHKKGPQEFEYQVAKDDWKNQKCKENGVVLVRIPHFVAYHDLERYITTSLRHIGIAIPSKNIQHKNPDEVYRNFTSGENIYS